VRGIQGGKSLQQRAVGPEAEAKRNELLSAQPDAKRMHGVLRALPTAAAHYRTQIDKRLHGNPTAGGPRAERDLKARRFWVRDARAIGSPRER
jgi:hypothetical protein